MGEYLQQRQGLLRLFIGMNIHKDSARFAVLRDDDWFPLFRNPIQKFRGVGFNIADGLDLGRIAQSGPPWVQIQSKYSPNSVFIQSLLGLAGRSAYSTEWRKRPR